MRRIIFSQKNNNMTDLLDVKEFIDLTLEEAKKKHNRIHVSRNDAQEFMRTMEFRPDRLNIEIDNGKITSAHYG